MIIKITFVSMCITLVQCALTMYDPFLFDYMQNSINEKKQPLCLKNYRHFVAAPAHTKIYNPTNAAAYCKTFANCQTCIRSEKYPCGWCHNYGCVINAHILCPMAKNARSLEARSSHHPNCNAIKHCQSSYDEKKQEINIKVKLHVADPAVYQYNIKCLITFSNIGRVLLLLGLISSAGNEVECQPMGKPEVAYLPASVQLLWGGANPDSNQLPLILYSCVRLSDTCEGCVKIPEQFGCGWCVASGTCIPKSHCFGKWSHDKSFCDAVPYPIPRRKYISYKVTGLPALGTFRVESASPSPSFQLPAMKEMSHG